MNFSGTLTVVDDMSNSPGGRKPSSGSSSHSYPSVPAPEPSVATFPGARLAIDVFRQKRSLLKVAGTVMSVVPEFTVKYCPSRAFSGRPPSAGGLKRGSRQVPVQVGGSWGSNGPLACVSLYVTRVR